ncbi:MAG: DUF445 family protein [Clostridia bacterium]|nr:DUF445 family protein [Clostridia bacterium]
MEWKIVFSPLMGAVIGYITNDLAVRMLFRPSRPLYIGKLRVPMTPGLIPKEKHRLAESIGKTVETHLLDETTVLNALTSDEMKEKTRQLVHGAIVRAQEDPRGLGEAAKQMTGGKSAEWIDTGREKVVGFLAERLIAADLGSTAARTIEASFQRKSPEPFKLLFGGAVDEKVRETLRVQVRSAVNTYVEHHAHEMVRSAVNQETEALLNKPVSALAEENGQRLKALEDHLDELYERALRTALPRALKAANLSRIVREKIESIPNEDLEHMVREVADKELKAIVYLGAALGFLMGFAALLWT